jgi:hypothetical protein
MKVLVLLISFKRGIDISKPLDKDLGHINSVDSNAKDNSKHFKLCIENASEASRR